ncbi:MAG: DMT family transporter [Geitlerinemataceae cyanobacterium]
MTIPYLGEFSALGAAFVWAFASLVFQRLGVTIAPLRLNLLKGVVSLLAFSVTIALGRLEAPTIDARTLLMLGGSGAIGIGLGDTAYFKALNCLGSRRTLLLVTSATPMTALLAATTLGETLGAQAAFGIAAIFGGIVWTIVDRAADIPGRGAWWQGAFWGIVAAAAQAVGAVMSRSVLAETDFPTLWASMLRIAVGIAPLLVWESLEFARHATERQAWRRIVTTPRILTAIALSSLLGTYLAIWLQQTSYKFAPVGIAQTLTSTSPLFALPLAAWAGEHVGWRSIFGVVLVLAGVALLFAR